jgi:glyceraldehyde-3-phosphate dehydrogenase (NADP+)
MAMRNGGSVAPPAGTVITSDATEPHGLLIGGSWVRTARTIDVTNPFDGKRVAAVSAGGPEHVSAAVAAAAASLSLEFPVHARYDLLMRTADRVEAAQDVYAESIALEGSKTIREARREPPRAASILRLAAEEGRRLHGETLPFDSRAGSENRVGYYFRFPVGVIAVITPFNDPLAMAAHKLGPALAAGNAIVLKPASATPMSAIRLAQDLIASGLPPGRLNVVTGSGAEIGDPLVADARVRMVTFTGGVATGGHIARTAGLKKLSMELGSNSPVIVMPDARLDHAVPAISAGAFAQAGQNCLGVQRVFVHDLVYDEFARRFVTHVSGLTAGSSLDEAVDVCAMINEAQAARVDLWIQQAVSGGARILVGGKREGAVMWPTVLEEIPRGSSLDCDEAYGPVVALARVSSLDEAIDRANAVDYGLHAAIFTESLGDAFEAVRRLVVGAVIVNDSTDYRLDIMPFGGTKLSGIGREGVRFACAEMTETRVVCFNLQR